MRRGAAYVQYELRRELAHCVQSTPGPEVLVLVGSRLVRLEPTAQPCLFHGCVVCGPSEAGFSVTVFVRFPDWAPGGLVPLSEHIVAPYEDAPVYPDML